MKREEYDFVVRAFLDDQIRFEIDRIDIKCGQVHAKRE